MLVVEDDEDVRRSTSDVLRVAGYRVAEADDSLKALEHLQWAEVDVVVLDLYLPGLGGLWLLDELKEPPPVVVVTSRERDFEVVMRMDKIFLYLKKPVPPPALLEAVDRAAAIGGTARKAHSNGKGGPRPLD